MEDAHHDADFMHMPLPVTGPLPDGYGALPAYSPPGSSTDWCHCFIWSLRTCRTVSSPFMDEFRCVFATDGNRLNPLAWLSRHFTPDSSGGNLPPSFTARQSPKKRIVGSSLYGLNISVLICLHMLNGYFECLGELAVEVIVSR